MGEVDDDGNSGASGLKKDPTKDEIDLRNIQEKIINTANKLFESGISKDLVYNIISDNNDGNRNSNSIKKLSVAKKILSEINKLKVKEVDN